MKYSVFPLFVLLLACSSKHERPKNEIHRIEFSYSSMSCFGSRPTFYMILDSTLNYQYFKEDDWTGKNAGYFKGNFSEGYWDTLNSVFNGISYKQLPDSFEFYNGGSINEIYIYYNDTSKHFYGMLLPGSLHNALSWLYRSAKSIKLQKSDSIYFPHRAESDALPPPF